MPRLWFTPSGRLRVTALSFPALLGCSVVMPASLRAQIPQCHVPTGYSSTFRDFRAPIDPGDAVRDYQKCVESRGVQVQHDPFAGIYEQHRLDAQSNFVVRLGRQVIGWLPFGDVLDAYEYVHTSNELTPDIRQGLERHFAAFRQQYQVARAAGSGTVRLAEARTLLAEWTAFKAQLEASLPLIKDEKTAALVRKQIAAGDGLAWSILLDGVQQARLPRDSARATLTAAGLGTGDQVFAELQTRLDAITQELGQRAGAADSIARAAEGAARVQRIGEYGAFAHSMLGVAAYAGIMPARDAQTMQGVIAGATQIATAVAIVQAGTAATALGPYGMAIAGGLTIAGALQGGSSGSDQLAGMLRQLAQQIAALQRSVDLGFANLSTQLGETEQRIMQRLSVVLQQTDLILAGQAELRAEVRALREDITRQSEEARVQANLDFVRRIPYHDRQCLRRFGWFGGKDREACLAAYSAVVRDFTTSANASLVGSASRALRVVASADDQYAALLAEAARLTGSGTALDAVHGPTLALIEERVRLFLTHNPKVATRAEAQAMLAQLDDLRARHARAQSVLQAPATRTAAQKAYASELARIIERVDRRSAQFVDTSLVTATDAVHLGEVRNAQQPSALQNQSQWFPASGPGLAALIGTAPPAVLVLGTAQEGFGAHTLLRDKLANYARAISVKDSAAYVITPEALRGFLWVEPCNAQSAFYAFPVRRAALANVLGGDVVALSAAGRGMLRICYTATLEDVSGDVVNPNNTNYKRDLLWQRVRTLGFDPSPFSGNHFCSRAPAYFNDTYMRHPEYRGSDWEKCHSGHVHHALYTRSRQLNSISFQLDVDLPGYRSATRTFTFSDNWATDSFDRCLLPVDTRARYNPAAVFGPFRQQYPLPVTAACPSVDGSFAAALPTLRRQLDTFLDSSGTTRRIGDPHSQEISYRAALQEVLTHRRNRNYDAYLTAILGPESEYAALDQLHAFQLALDAVTPAPVTVASTEDGAGLAPDSLPRHMSGRELRTYLGTMLRDPVTGTLATAAAVAPTVAGAPAPTSSLAPPASGFKGLVRGR